MAFFETFSWIVTMMFIVFIFCLIACAAVIVVAVIMRLLFGGVRAPLGELYFSYLDWKQEREKTKYSRKSQKKKRKYYDDYSKFR